MGLALDPTSVGSPVWWFSIWKRRKWHFCSPKSEVFLGILRLSIMIEMLPQRARLTAVFLLLICLLCPLIESLDVWHGTLDGGNDTEFALVIAALCVGVGYIAARLIFKSEFVASVFSSILAHRPAQFCAFVLGLDPLCFVSTSPPLLPLRI